MHELSICQSLVDAVMEEVARVNPPVRRVLTVRVVVGDLRQVVPDFMQDAYRFLTEDGIARESRLEIRAAPVIGRCRECNWEGRISDRFFQCPRCESFDIETTGGMELYLEGLEVEQEDEEETGDLKPET